MSSATTVDLTDITAAVGPTIFSFLPLGSLLNGLSSPLLVNKIFRAAIFEHLKEAACISFSPYPHLRKIKDDQLICLVRNILGESTCLKTKYLDLSKCRNLKGDGIIFCLKSMPNIERICLSSAMRFQITNNFHDPTLKEAIKRLHYVDVSGCTKLNTDGISCLASTLPGSNIRVLDFSSCSTQIGDDAAMSVAENCYNLECINVSGSTKLTTFGVAIISYICRRTLRCLSVSGCKSVSISTLLFSHARACPLNVFAQWRDSGEDVSVLRRNLRGENNDDNSFLTPAYVEALIEALHPVLNSPLLVESDRIMRLCKEYEERWGHRQADRHEEKLFGQLEKLDISDNTSTYDGVLVVISWLNKGKLREINLSSLFLHPHAVSALAYASGPHLKCMDISSSKTVTRPFHVRPPPPPWTSLICVRGVCELDLSSCHALVNESTNISEMENLRSLKLDNLGIRDYNVEPLGLLSKTKRLLHLSVNGCYGFNVSILTKAKALNPNLNLLELDVRDAFMDVPLSVIRDTFPSLLKLNNRCTKLGTSRIQQHQQNYQWRIGRVKRKSRESDKRRNVCPVVGSASLSLNCCSIQLTGFSKADCTEQEMFGCKTCHIEFGRFVCMTCSKACHIALGHEVFSIGYGPGYCDCSILSDCLCMKDVVE